MAPILAGIAPIFALILVGYGLRRLGFPGEGFWPDMERLTYYVLFPALLLDSLPSKSLSGMPLALPATALVLAVLGMAVLLFAARPWLGFDGPAFTSLFQGSIRPNTYVGLSAAFALMGSEGLAHSAVVLVVIIPLVNTLAVAALNRYGANGNGRGLGGILRELGRNPLVLACLAGLALNVLGWRLPFGLSEVIAILGRAALPLGLLAVGAGLRLTRIRLRPLVLSGLTHLILLPLFVAGACALLGVDPVSRTVLVIFTAVPAAASAYILARQMGGDHELMAALITGQTLLSAATMPLMVAFLG